MKGKKGLKVLGIVLASIVAFFAVINIIPPKKNVSENPFIAGKGNLPMIAAHRGGGDCNPENTMLAFREAVKTFDVEIIESDIVITYKVVTLLTARLWSLSITENLPCIH